MTEDATEVVAREPYKTLIAARDALNTLAESLCEKALEAGSPHGYFLTRATVACEDAGDAIFNVCNTLHSYLDDKDAGRAIGVEPREQAVGEGPEVPF